MLTLTMGANAPVDDALVEITVTWPTGRGLLDCSAYLLGEDGRVRDDADMIFYNQPADVTGAVRIESDAGVARLVVDLARLPAAVVRVAMCATVAGGDITMRDFAGLTARLDAAGERRLRFAPDLADAHRSLRVVELYRHKGRWKLRAVGQGFADGLDKMAGAFGVMVDGEPPAPSPPPRPSPPPQLPSPPDEPLTFEPIRPSPRPPAANEVLLTERSPTTSWPSLPQQITLTLSWSSRCGGVEGRPRALDLALGCFFALADGTRGVLQAQGRRTAGGEPALLSLAAATTADAGGVQLLTFDGRRLAELTGATIYAVIPTGAPHWDAATVRLSIAVAGRPPVVVAIEQGEDGCAAVALAQITPTADGLEIARAARFALREPELDATLGWGLAWRP